MLTVSSLCLALLMHQRLGVVLGTLTRSSARFGGQVPAPSAPLSAPYLIPLRRELSPVKRGGKVVSYKASYSGVIHVGRSRPQEFRVVFDTGSGHVVLPSIGCKSDACVRHQRYDLAASDTGEAIMKDGSAVPPEGLADKVTIGFGTGRITGEFVREQVCLGPAPVCPRSPAEAAAPQPCVETQVVVAVEMSKRPFELFDFDGILGLGLRSLAISGNFSFFGRLAERREFEAAHFGVFLAEGDRGEDSEIAIGGHNPARLVGPLHWVPMAKPELGYWQVEIVAFRVDGVKLDICNHGDCLGILDTGTSHLGIPSAFDSEVAGLLNRPAGDTKDCRFSDAPTIDIELRTVNLTLHPRSYMRTLPLSEDIMVDTNVGVSPTSYLDHGASEGGSAGGGGSRGMLHGTPDENTTGPPPRTLCTAKLLPVSWPAPLGPNLFILGEPVLHRYYTVFDWAGLRAGFGLAAQGRGAIAAGGEEALEDGVIMIQMAVLVRPARPAPAIRR